MKPDEQFPFDVLYSFCIGIMAAAISLIAFESLANIFNFTIAKSDVYGVGASAFGLTVVISIGILSLYRKVTYRKIALVDQEPTSQEKK